MRTVATRVQASQSTYPALYMAIEIGERQWKLGFTVGAGQRARVRVVPARDMALVAEEIRLAKARFGVGVDAPVYSCYEAGREGFWPHRALERIRVENLVVDSSSIEVSRRRRRAKTDRMDVTKLVSQRIRHQQGERRVWGVVRVPTPEQEERRQLHRELMTARRDRTRSTNRIKSLLATQGARLEGGRGLPEALPEVWTWNGLPLPTGLRVRIEREFEKVHLLERQIAAAEAERKALLEQTSEPDIAMVHKLMELRGIGVESAWIFTMELFAWRSFRNTRELTAVVGLAPTPHQSGDESRELGITKAGNCHVRALAIEIAWRWLYFQPESALSLWYERNFARGGSRRRRIGAVAVARKLLIALWKYVDQGVLPEGAVLKPGC